MELERVEGEAAAPRDGPPGSVRGGIIGLAFDELLGCIGAVSNVGGFAGTLTIPSRSLTSVGKLIRLRSWIDRTKGALHSRRPDRVPEKEAAQGRPSCRIFTLRYQTGSAWSWSRMWPSRACA